MMPPSWKTEIEETVEKAAHSSSEWQKADNDKNASEIASEIKALHDAYQAQNNKPKKSDKVKRALDVATVFLLFATALFTGLAWWVFRGQLNALRTTDEAIHRQLTFMENAERPYLHLGEAKLIRKVPHDPNAEVSFKIVNSGKGTTVLRATNINCEVIDYFPPVPVYKATTKTARNVVMSGGVIGSDGLGTCKFSVPITESDWVKIDAGYELILFSGTLKYEGLLNVTYTRHFGFVTIRDDPNGTFGNPSAYNDAYNYEEIDQPKE